jgi:hypothetical protein
MTAIDRRSIFKTAKGGNFMDLSAVIVVIVMTLLFFGSIVWLAVYSRKRQPKDETTDISKIVMEED